MYTTKPLTAAIAGITVFALDRLAALYGWYHTVPSFDKLMHFLGGAFVFLVLAAYWRNKSIRTLIAAVVLIGLLWEGYEYVVQSMVGAELITLPDSVGDLLFDTLGAIGAAYFFRSAKKRYITNKVTMQ